MRVSRREAQAIITAELRKLSAELDDRTQFKSGPNVAARSHEWWIKYDDHESATTDRNKALLRAYMAIGGERLWAIGLPLSDKERVYMDRSVMRRLEKGGFVEWRDGKTEPYFLVTPAGQTFISD
jgi:hypothetical protein